MEPIRDVLSRESLETAVIYLHEEGIFYKAYGYSAFRFARHVRAYRVGRRHYKKLGRDVCSLGFPQSVLDKLLVECGLQREDAPDGVLVLRGKFAPFTQAEFEAWMNAVPLSVPKPRGASSQKKTPPAAAPQQPPLPGAEPPATVPVGSGSTGFPAAASNAAVTPAASAISNAPGAAVVAASVAANAAAISNAPATAVAPNGFNAEDAAGARAAEAVCAEVLRRLQDFPLESATPVECVFFLSGLRKRLRDIEC